MTDPAPDLAFPDPPGPGEPVPETTTFAEPPADGRPHRDDPKDEWVAWAISRGVPSFEAWSTTKPDLMKGL